MNIEEERKKIGKMCSLAELLERRRGNAVICKGRHGSRGEECVCTTSLDTGHASPDADYDIEKMRLCPHREPGVQE